MRIERHEHFDMGPLEGNGDKLRAEPVEEFRASVILWAHRTEKTSQDEYVVTIAERHLSQLRVPKTPTTLPFRATESYVELITHDPKVFAKWVKDSAEAMNNIIQSERLDKRNRAFWEAAKEAFQILIEKIQRSE